MDKQKPAQNNSVAGFTTRYLISVATIWSQLNKRRTAFFFSARPSVVQLTRRPF
jgi:hypothetical protein